MINKIPRDILMGWQVLLIDDDPKSLDVALLLLKHYGATVHTAINGEEGLQQARSLQPRFILSDISMPVMDGWELLIQLKNDETLRHIPVIALTAHAMAGDKDRALRAGFHNYISKPLIPATFMRDLLALLTAIPELNLQL